MTWHRYRFATAADDPRPLIFEPSYPYWITGYGISNDDQEYTTIVAYLPETHLLTTYWPEAEDAEYTVKQEITYTSRFPKPEWT